MPKIKYNDTSSSESNESFDEFQDDSDESPNEPKPGPSNIKAPEKDKRKTGTSGRIPRLTCIEYPGIVKNPDRMLETLGGIEEISRVRKHIHIRSPLKITEHFLSILDIFNRQKETPNKVSPGQHLLKASIR